MAFLSLIAPNVLFPDIFLYQDKVYLEYLQYLTGRLRVASWGQTSLALVCRCTFQRFLEVCLYIWNFLELTMSPGYQFKLFFVPYKLQFTSFLLGAVFNLPVSID